MRGDRGILQQKRALEKLATMQAGAQGCARCDRNREAGRGHPAGYDVGQGELFEERTVETLDEHVIAGKAGRIWIMDRGIPTEDVLAEMRACHPPIHYLVGTPKGRLGKLEGWPPGLGLAAGSRRRGGQTAATHRRTLRAGSFPRPPGQGTRHAPVASSKLWARLAELQRMAPARDTLLLKLGAAKSQYPAAWRLVQVQVAKRRG